eukprot:TRINITY_DN13804_c0_g1_i1.p2 TRINITY_DN13804_c0_g1~~TRINITY_DN13804_c0_g1_i1.p2  ORF type:complete len:352 (-),score=83.63 TRINITY_DN13804_c0_g1_i1:424-1479(-)
MQALGQKVSLRQTNFRARRQADRRVVKVFNDNCLIVNTKGGGHAFIGYHLAEKLLEKGHTVTILNNGDPAKIGSKEPYSQYPALESKGVTVKFADPTDISNVPEGPFQVVYDNNGKDMENCQPLIDHFKGKVEHYVFVGSAGAYADDLIEPMKVEGDTRKAKAGHKIVEDYLESEGLPYTVFQPLYLYGPYTNKDCEQWFVDRIIRDRPVPLPAPGVQLTSLSNIKDVAALMAMVPGNEKTVKQQFNSSTDRCITFTGIVKAIAKELGKEPKIVLYNPAEMGLGKGEGFPFRTNHFFAGTDKAKMVLGWAPEHNFLSDVKSLCEAYVASGRADKEIDFSVDDKILAKVGAA